MARRAQIIIDIESKEAREQVARLGEGFEVLRSEAADGVRRTQAAIDDLGKSANRARRPTQNYTNLLFTATEAAQDAQYGVRAAANNITFFAEQATQAAARSGGLMSVLRGMGSAILTPGGALAGLTALVALGPQIGSFFSKLVSDAEDASVSLDDLAAAAQDVVSVQAQIEGLDLTEQEARAARERLQQRISSLDARDQNAVTRTFARGLQGLSTLTGGVVQVTEGDRRALAANQQRNDLERALEAINEQLDKIDAKRRVLELLRGAGVSGSGGGATALGLPPAGVVTPRDRLSRGEAVEFPALGSLLTGSARTLLGGVGAVNDRLARRGQFEGFGSQRGFLQARIQLLTQALQQLRQSGISPTAATVQDMRDALKTARDQMDQLQGSTAETTHVLEGIGQSAALTGLSTMTSILQEGANASERMQSALRSVTQTASQQLLRLAFQGGAFGLSGGATGLLGAGLGVFSGLFHEGTSYYPGGVGIVGERGPELVRLPRGSEIQNATDTRRNMRAARQGGGAGSAQLAQMQRIANKIERMTQNPPPVVIDPMHMGEKLTRYEALR
jgi:hypothetical protein